MTLNVYKQALSQKKEFLQKRMMEIPLSAVQEKARLCLPSKGFINSLKKDFENYGSAWVMDIKRANAHGDVFFDEKKYKPDVLAEKAEKAGASCISVTTDDIFCKGSNHDFTKAREAVKLPMLRRDFIVDSYQVIESRALQADCIPLILTMLDDTQARIIEQTAIQWGMDVMIVVHNEYEIERALSHLQSKFIAIDNRDIIKGKVELDNVRRLIKMVPKGYFTMATSGIRQERTIKSYYAEGVGSVMLAGVLQKQSNLSKLADKLFSRK